MPPVLLSDNDLRARLDPIDTDWGEPELRDAAVIAPLFTRDGRDWLLYTRRNRDLGVHAGERSFPGGQREPGENALQCALREMHEEIGLPARGVDVLGRLPRRQSRHHSVHPFVGRVAPPRDLVLDPTEVDAVVEIPIAELRVESRWERRDVKGRGRVYRLPFFEHGEDTLWGLTAVVTLDLLARLG